MSMKFLFYFVLSLLPSYLISGTPVPGRLNNPEIYTAQFGKMRIFFYMTPEKDQLAREFIHDISENLIYGVYPGTYNFPAPLVIPLVALFPDPVDYDQEGNPVYVDQKGMKLFKKHALDLKEIAENTLDLHIEGVTQDMNLVLNFDAHKFHQDNFEAQYDYIKQQSVPIPRYSLIEDLTLTDWEMSKGTFSATIMQDPESKDRFLFPLFPKEVVCNFFTEPALYLGSEIAPEYPGHVTMPFHSVMPTIDWESSISPGSTKGKRVSVVLRGVVKEEEVDDLQSRSRALPINRAKFSEQENEYVYPNGLIIREFPDGKPLSIKEGRISSLLEWENNEVFENSSEENSESISRILDLFQIDCPIHEVVIKHIVKKGPGFTKLSLEELNISNDKIVVLCNRSKLPKDYHYVNIAQDFIKQGLPWIQLYNTPPETAMLIPPGKLNELSLTPIEEILYRDPKQDIAQKSIDIFKEKISTEIDLFIFPKK